MTELETALTKLHDAEARLKSKEHDWFVIRFILTPAVLSVVAALVALTITVIKQAG